MKWILLLSLLGIAAAQKLFFRPQQELKDSKKNSFGIKKTGYYYTSRKTATELAEQVSSEVVVCPGGKAACNVGNTCCLINPTTKQYGCCPLPNAVCCKDNKHCCPFKTTCDEIKQNCRYGGITVSWLEKTEAISLDKGDNYKFGERKENLMSVVCPDGLHMCETGQSCCKNNNGYACCPFENAVCCSDEIHCCPENSKCNVAESKCDGTNNIFNMSLKQKASVSPTEIAVTGQVDKVVCPDGSSECPDGSTCCKLKSGDWGCCPQPKAVCCSDGVHCCPNGYTCEVSKGTCTKGDLQTEWFMKTPASLVNAVKCPDGQSECPDGSTCCKLSSGTYGCCPLPKAVCCSDGVHCCPNGYTCEVSKGTCTKGDLQTEWFMKTPASLVNTVKCPDGQSECPDGSTCCKLSSGTYGCCPLPKAVCCSDGVHCCPYGYTCEVSKGTCTKGDLQTEWFMKTPASLVNAVKCPDGQSECPDGSTCCKLSSGKYGCCPLPKAVCCSDGVHCCPNGYTCEVSKGTCTKGDLQTEWFMKTPASLVNAVKCPDGQSECPDGSTCCKLSSGKYGCCPLPKAVCCSDGVHCCPNGYTCEVSKGTCTKGDLQTEWFMKTPASLVNAVKCPDGQSECPDGSTCCKLSSGKYGCCPLPKAVCCSDGVHCCPNGYTCEVSKGTCTKGDLQTEWFMKTPASLVNAVKCPDGQSECPDGSTCCKLSSGKYGCCPLPKAVCCSDGVHCCPNGYTCEVSKGTCTKGDLQTEWFMKTPASLVNVVRCPDGQSECPDGSTCCKLSSGKYGCCPLPKAVCCSDGVHCCPNGYTCEVSKGTCTKGDLQTEWFMKTPASLVNAVKCPDGQSECPDGSTCCKLSSGKYGCCPLPKAVCCSDGVHCCPNGYTCEVSKGTCTKGDLQTEWFMKTPASLVNVVRCPDGQSECPDGSTCCKLSSGKYGCCPLPKAVCCSDGVHCCPNGYTCEVSKGTCTKGDLQTEWFMKTPASLVNAVKCPDGQSECPDGSTCCKLSSGKYGCCPLPKAVCCSDGVHCCPNGYTCEVSKGTCTKGDLQTEWFMKTPASLVNVVRCPDGQSECPDGSTCCKLSSGKYRCCPLPKAVCCSDGVHCCPNGYTCEVSKGTCTKGDLQTEWFMKTPASLVNAVKCPDGQSECPDGSTCCKLSSGKYGCCPLPKAVCCSDGVHCCPNGYTCEVSKGTCTKGDLQTEWFMKTPASLVNAVKCPDGQSECPDGSTCCKLSSGKYGCCPLPKAVCCSDGVHCCPNGYTCEVSKGTCTKGDLQTKWFVKTPARQVNSVVCPDEKSMCQDGQTCCQLSSGGYGCCPIPKAVCCNDHIHCCPNGYTCDVSKGTCNKGDLQTEWFVKTPANQVNKVQCPDHESECPDGSTCCMLASGQYGCCPIPKAVCCNDHIHCCPSGYTCDVSKGICNKGDLQTEWFVKTPARQVNKVQCPDHESECPDGSTCCMLASGQYGCCPIPKAVCCSDHIHCCPEDTKCEVSEGKCIKGDNHVDWFTKTEAVSTKIQLSVVVPPNTAQVGSVICPDGSSECPNGQTCCKLSTGEYGCCPMPKAVCCSDGKHCCPSGYTCDVSKGTCTKGDLQTEWFVKTLATQVNKVVCPDGKSECESGQTCCKSTAGGYGCCPIPKAVCCDDHKHCCPENTKCDVSQGRCIKGDSHIEWFTKTEAVSTQVQLSVVMPLNSVKCDDTHECPTGNTCCKLKSGDWGCCPAPNAVCCEDHVHCCKHGEKCDVSHGKCLKGDTVTDWLVKSPARKLDAVVCPGGQFECPDDTTCCKGPNGHWQCCPMKEAVCCDDQKHCCPKGTTCDEQGCCNKEGITIDGFSKTLATPRTAVTKLVRDVICPDGCHCPDGCTCCKMNKGDNQLSPRQYGCCAYASAVCCDDGKHCCPNGFVCNYTIGGCTRKDISLPWTQMTGENKEVDTTVLDKVSDKKTCPGGKVTCPQADNTCCQDGKGGYYCSPYKNATCCIDKKTNKPWYCPPRYICGDDYEICRTPDVVPLRSSKKIFIEKAYP